MLRSLALAVLLASSACAAIWPDQLGKYQRKSATGSAITGDVRPEWDEYGEEAIERADYGSFKSLAFKFKDTTGAYAASLEPAGRVTSRIGNYLVMCSGACPKDFLPLTEAALPNVSHTPIPALGEYLPRKGRIVGSERYVLGPSRLRENFPQIPESAAAFQFGTEGAIAHYHNGQNEPNGAAILAIFSYPTPQLARQQAHAFETLQGAAVKRTGPLVAVVLGAGDQAVAQHLLAGVNYQASVSLDDQVLPLVLKPQSAAQMVLAIFTLAGLLLGFCLLSGLAFGGIRVLARRFGYSDAGRTLITLHLSDK